MEKHRELSEPNSCWNRAEDGELVFVLLARDIAAPNTVIEWAKWRVEMGKNDFNDPQIREALAWVARVRQQHQEREKCKSQT